MQESLGQLLPVYFIADESPSMKLHNAIGQVNDGIESLFGALLRNPLAAAKVRLSIVGFSNLITEHRSMCDIREDDGVPVLSLDEVYGGTSFRAALQDLLTRIPRDIRQLRGMGYQSHRPAVFFLTDGEPNPGEDWRSVHRKLMDRASFPASPNIIAFGVNDATPTTISTLASDPQYGFVAVPGADMGMVLTEFIKSLVRSVVQTGSALATGGGTLVIPRPDPNYLEVAADIIPDFDR